MNDHAIAIKPNAAQISLLILQILCCLGTFYLTFAANYIGLPIAFAAAAVFFLRTKSGARGSKPKISRTHYVVAYATILLPVIIHLAFASGLNALVVQKYEEARLRKLHRTDQPVIVKSEPSKIRIITVLPAARPVGRAETVGQAPPDTAIGTSEPASSVTVMAPPAIASDTPGVSIRLRQRAETIPQQPGATQAENPEPAE